MSTGKRAASERGEVLRYGRDGEALVRMHDGGEAWARHVVPGDEGEFITKRYGKRVEATLTRLATSSPHRQEPPCALVERCGGCPWMFATPAYAHEQKRVVVQRAIGDCGVDVELRPSPSEVGYRRRARLAFDVQSAGVRVGYRRARSDSIVDVSRCLVLSPVLATALTVIREHLAPMLGGRGELRLALGDGQRPVLALHSEGSQSSEVYALMRTLVDEHGFAGTALFASGASRPGLHGDPVERTPALDGGTLEGTIDGFSQANDPVALDMARTVLGYAEPEGMSILELYAGHGNLGIGLAARARAFVAVEQSTDAAEALRRNLAARSLAGKVLARDAARAPRDACDVVVLDPPRTGAEEAIPVVLAARPRRIVMASCDPRTLERDLRRLVAGGYRVTRATAFDMFPGTAHVESVVRLDREE